MKIIQTFQDMFNICIREHKGSNSFNNTVEKNKIYQGVYSMAPPHERRNEMKINPNPSKNP